MSEQNQSNTQTKYILHVADGKEVANAIGGLYVNSFSNPGKDFYECMLKRDRNIKHNFTMLCLEWFRALAKVEYYDERNKASVLYAQSIAPIFRYDEFLRQKTSVNGVASDHVFKYRNDTDAANLLEKYLRLSLNNDDFIAKMLTEHRINQQSFSRMCCEWFKELSKNSVRHNRYVIMAKKAVAKYTGFRFV